MQILKTAVIAMGVLILAGFGLLIYGFATQLGKGGEAEVAPLVPAPAAVPARVGGTAGFGDLSAGLEEGEILLETLVEGGRLLLHTRRQGGREQIRFYDVQSGRQVGTLVLTPVQE